MVATAALDFFPVQGAHKSFGEVHSFYERFGHADRIAFAESYNQHQYSLQNQEAALEFLDRFNKMPLRRGLAPVTIFTDAELHVTKRGQVAVDYPDAQPLLRFIARYQTERQGTHRTTLAQLYRTSEDPNISSWTTSPSTGSKSPRQLQWETVGTTAFNHIHIDRYLLHHSTYLEMPLLHIHSDEKPSKGIVVWFSLYGKATEKDWPQILPLLREGYEVYSFDFRGLGETRMNYRARSEDDPELVKGNFDQAYISPLSSVLAGYVYNSLLTGRPYFLQMMDDLKIVQLFIDSRNPHPDQPLTIAATGEAYGFAVRFQQIDRKVKIFPTPHTYTVDWSTLVNQGQEEWPVAFLMPSGSLVH
jgi:hypothetical protein